MLLLSLVDGDHPRDREDFEGSFRIGYNEQENALYVAVEVQDESAVLDTTGGIPWYTLDGCHVVVDAYHEERTSRAMNL